jgi:hypothetical protein
MDQTAGLLPAILAGMVATDTGSPITLNSATWNSATLLSLEIDSIGAAPRNAVWLAWPTMTDDLVDTTGRQASFFSINAIDNR